MKKILLGVAGMVCGLALVFSVAAPAQAAALTSAQVQAIIGLLQSFGADQSVINSVSAVLGGTSSGSQTCSTFADLAYGSFDTEPGGRVSQLQRWLGISSSTFGFGTYGPKTLALWNSRCGGGTTNNVNFSASPTYGVAPLSVTFTITAEAGEYSVEFGDGQSTTVTLPAVQCFRAPCNTQTTTSHSYAAAGTYIAKLIYQPSFYCPPGAYCPMMMPAPKTVGTVTITVTDRVTTGGAPSINGLDAPNSLSVGQTGTWTVRASAPSGTQLRYSVVWGDEGWGSTAGSAQQAQSNVQTSAMFSHTYQNAGTYSPTFTVSNDYGSVQTSASVVVGGSTSGVSFSASPTSGTAPLTTYFWYVLGADSADGYSINFGDGTSGSLSVGCAVNPFSGTNACPRGLTSSHTYTSGGTYVATLSQHVGGPYGPEQQVGTATITVTGGTSNATFSASPQSGWAPLGVTFTTNVSGAVVDFGDGASAKVESNCTAGFTGSTNCNTGSYFASHYYQSAGTYTATIKRIIGVREIYGGGDTNIYETIGTVTITVMTGWL